MLCLTAKDSWRQLRNEIPGLSIGYAGFCKWLQQFGINARQGIGEDALTVLRNYAQAKASGPTTRLYQNGQAKLAVLKVLKDMNSISGRQIIDLAERFDACSRPTIYRRSHLLFGEPFSASRRYTRVEARKLICGA